MSPLPTTSANLSGWIEDLATIGKTAKIAAYKIITQQTTISCKQTITKYRALLNIKPKTIHKKIFQPATESSIDCLHNFQGHNLTAPTDIANEIYNIKQTSFQRQTPICDDIIDHPTTCMCVVGKYPWHTEDGLTLEKRGPPNTQINTQFT